jgi:CheY-like chemotaxis protein
VSHPVSDFEEHPNQTILLAENDDEVRERLAGELRHDGYQVISVKDGLALADYLERTTLSQSNVLKPDLVIADTELPGYGGLELCRAMSTSGALPFILVAEASPGCWEEAERAGAAHVLSKPVDLDELLDAVACYLDGEEVDDAAELVRAGPGYVRATWWPGALSGTIR